ncbi:hypothetical protein [Saccharomonospora saliphila]|uniref:hypothetical protein n=1 Tax=Saccharomonospora saliphila TaxID=369829 RepID=UPI0003724149|nr:hypothetical protein [Saccharomonospora saliphila]
MTGFGSVPDELRETARQISDTVGGAADLLWQGPSGDYGHPAVQAGWATFVERVRGAVEQLRAEAEEHGAGLTEAARRYLESEDESRGIVERFEHGLGADGGPVAGGITGGIRNVLGGASTGVGGAR